MLKNGIDTCKKTIAEKSKAHMDYQVFIYVFFLVSFGVLMVYSASSFIASRDYGNAAYYAIKQLVSAVLGFVGMYVMSRIRYQYFKYISKILLILSGILLLLVFIIGSARNGSTRWIILGPISFQPSEFAKLSIIIYMAHICSVKRKDMQSFIGTLKMFSYPIVIVLIIAIENLSTAIICAVIAGGIWIIVTPKPKYALVFLAAGVFIVIILIAAKGYRGDRLTAYFNPEETDAGYQTMQALYAIGSGGFFGKGLGQSIQKRGFIPEAQNDMIFAIVCEELGVFGATGVIIVYLMLLWRLKYIADQAYDLFGSLIVVGVIAHLAVQTLLNMCVVTKILPNTGVTLPFISYGGTSLTILLAEMGLVLSVSRQMEVLIDRRRDRP